MTESHIARRGTRQADQDRTLAAMHDLEAALADAAPGREPSWRAAVLDAVVVLDDATAEEHTNAVSPDSLLSDIKRSQPRLRTRVRGYEASTNTSVKRSPRSVPNSPNPTTATPTTRTCANVSPGCSPHSGTNAPVSPT